MAADFGFGASSGAGNKVSEFSFEWFFFGNRNWFPNDPLSGKLGDDRTVGGDAEDFSKEGAFLFVFGGEAKQVTTLVLVIEGEVGVFLEDANFAEFILTNATGGDVGNATILEAETHIGDIFAIAEDGDANGIDLGDGGANEMENNFEVMNHHIEDYPDIEASSWVGGKASGFDEAGMS